MVSLGQSSSFIYFDKCSTRLGFFFFFHGMSSYCITNVLGIVEFLGAMVSPFKYLKNIEDLKNWILEKITQLRCSGDVAQILTHLKLVFFFNVFMLMYFHQVNR